MGKIFDALEKSGREQHGPAKVNGGFPTKEPNPSVPEEAPVESAQPVFPAPEPVAMPDSANADPGKGNGSDPEAVAMEPQAVTEAPPQVYRSKYPTSDMDYHLVAYHKPHSFESEQFKMLRTNILFPVTGAPPKTIMVTSALPGEGKTFVACNLAISIAQGINEHVLLMDCDIRKPNVHARFGFDEGPGLSNYLSTGNTPLSSLLLKTRIDKLTLLPGGSVPPNPAELLSSQQMAELMGEVKKRYSDRYVVVDSPPPHLTAETNVIARRVDAIILVIRYGVTRREVVSDLIDTIGRDKVIGVLFNQFSDSTSGIPGLGKYGKYYGGYYEGYHSK